MDKHKVSISEVVDKALKAIGWAENFSKCSRGRPDPEGNYYGVGMACSYRGVSLGAEGEDFCAAKITVLKGGKVKLEVGVAENGQGLKTVMAKICASELKIPIEHIVYEDVNTLSLPDSKPTVASRGTIVGGNAVIDASSKILTKTGGAPPSGFVGLCELGTWWGPKVNWDEEKGQGNAYFSYVYACQAAELKVNKKTGKVSVLKMVGAHDVGKAINSQMAKGQIYGGMIMGMGFALKEAVIQEKGVIMNRNFDGYRVVNSQETPEMEAIIVENKDLAGPYGAKSLGEPVNELMGGAIANAIYYATGARFRELPITAERILARLSSPL